VVSKLQIRKSRGNKVVWVHDAVSLGAMVRR
jgi:hypothetical protein